MNYDSKARWISSLDKLFVYYVQHKLIHLIWATFLNNIMRCNDIVIVFADCSNTSNLPAITISIAFSKLSSSPLVSSNLKSSERYFSRSQTILCYYVLSHAAKTYGSFSCSCSLFFMDIKLACFDSCWKNSVFGVSWKFVN